MTSNDGKRKLHVDWLIMSMIDNWLSWSKFSSIFKYCMWDPCKTDVNLVKF